MVGFTISSFDREIGATAAEGKKLRKAVSDVFNVAENNLEGSLRRVKNECSILATAKEQDHARYSKILKELRKYASYMRQQAKKKTGSAASLPPVDATSSNTSAEPVRETSLTSEEPKNTEPQPTVESSRTAAQTQTLEQSSKQKPPDGFEHKAPTKTSFPRPSRPSLQSGAIGLQFGRRVPFGERPANTLVGGRKEPRSDTEVSKEADKLVGRVMGQRNDTELNEAENHGRDADKALDLSSKATTKMQNEAEQQAGPLTQNDGGSSNGSRDASTRRPSSFLANILALQRGKGF